MLYKCFSDLIIQLDDGKQLKAHKFILTSRSSEWGVDLNIVTELDLSGRSQHEFILSELRINLNVLAEHLKDRRPRS